MCYQVLELYSACRCVYYQHPVDRCPRYGAPGHGVTQRTILVGYACLDHSSHSYSSDGHSYSEEGYASRPPKQRKRLDHALQDWKIQADQEISPKKTRSDEGNIRLEKEDDPEALVGESISRQHTAPLESNKPGHDGDDFEDYGSIHDDIDSEGSSSDESVASEAVTVISIASSTTTVDSDATEAIFRRLLLFQDLRYLWPQLVRRCVTTRMSVLTIERLLRRYSEDLSNLAASTEIMNDSDGSICLTACRFVRRSRLSIAHRISEFHHAEKDDYTEVDDDIKERLKKTIDETSGGFDDINFNYATSERFLFGTEPVIALQSSVKTLVGSQHPEGNGLGFGLFKMAEVHLSNIVSLVYEPPIKPGSHRIRWQCVGWAFPSLQYQQNKAPSFLSPESSDDSFQICGQKLYDDYTELQPGAILKLEQLLKEYCSERQVSKALLDLAAKLKPSRQNSIIAGFVKSCSSFWASNRTDTNLPRHQDSKLPPGELGVCSMAPESAEGDHNFVLLCVPFMRWVAKLWQAEVCRINSDQDFFRVLRYYYNRRGKTHWTRLRKVEAINFVKVSKNVQCLSTYLSQIFLLAATHPPPSP